ncbi:MAG: KilA-N domain-containing protein [Gomphosphaeria aponina SAG 52.96 = DSM 107014]|uniref:KilA-N domain-containing protein n=1 Tax=Gomphosphaeria aponina SAG 52.96 = DSM 107014 TaxID=1521640 RepID=A0A941GYN8_9CHRO|nr:KilA-N domain-containing protein [Gomphosphaeria aponina SAG 52.96 = DSM 107014]
MMSNNEITCLEHNYLGNLIEQRVADGYVNLTQMAKTGNKRLGNYLRLNSTRAYLEVLSIETQIRVSGLITISSFTPGKGTGDTWGHPEVAIDLALWISPQFRVWANFTLKQIIQGKETESERSPKALTAAKATRQIYELVGEINPRITQYLIDHCISEIMETLPPSRDSNQTKASEGQRLRGVVEIAEDMGYRCTLSTRTKLGKYVRERMESDGVKEIRLVNGTMREVWCYEDSEQLREIITMFFLPV